MLNEIPFFNGMTGVRDPAQGWMDPFNNGPGSSSESAPSMEMHDGFLATLLDADPTMVVMGHGLRMSLPE